MQRTAGGTPGSPTPTPASSALLFISRNFRGVASLDQPEKKAEDKEAGKIGRRERGKERKGGRSEKKKEEREGKRPKSRKERRVERKRRKGEGSQQRSP